VEAVVDSRKDRRGRTEYRLKWKRVEDGKEEAEVEVEAEGEEQNYSWVAASACHCEELISEFEQRQQSQGQQQAPAVGAVLIELLEEVETYHTILIEDVTAIIAVDVPGGDEELSAGVVEESDAVRFRVTEEGEEEEEEVEGEEGEEEEDRADRTQPAGIDASTDPSPAVSSSSASLASSASSFVRRSVSPLVSRVSAVLSAFHKAPEDSDTKQHPVEQKAMEQ